MKRLLKVATLAVLLLAVGGCAAIDALACAKCSGVMCCPMPADANGGRP